jgi:alkanesulfonate monooxygenase SsuD/methylene tetrahydromethanopterin reductase-like flavin-dependent oxidoreductase (luciferase family)
MATQRHLRIGVTLEGAGRHPAAWQFDDDPGTLLTLARVHAQVEQAEQGDLDLVVHDDAFGLQPGGADVLRGRLDALLALAAVAPLTSTIGLVAVTDVTHTEPFHLAKNLATLDLVSGGRAAWWPRVSTSDDTAAMFGRKDIAPLTERWAEAADVIEVVRHLWDSWEDDAVIRDVPSGRYLDARKVHYVDFAGRFFSVRGPSITPRPPQGQPPVVLAIDEPEAMAVATDADIALVEAPTVDEVADRRAELRRRAAAAGQDELDVAVLAAVDVLLAPSASDAETLRRRLDAHGPSPANPTLAFDGDAAGFVELVAQWVEGDVLDGVLVRPVLATPTLHVLVHDVMPRLVDRGLRPTTRRPSTLRERLGLARPANRYATSARPAT